MDEAPIKKTALHPKVSDMVNAAIAALAEPKGSSLVAINKYINSNYNVDVQKLSVYIKKYLKSAVERGEIVKPSGKGARGSFKMSKQKVEAKPKDLKQKSLKLLKEQTSTPKKTLKPKKAFIAASPVSPVKRMKSANDKEAPANSALAKAKTKIVKKPRVSVPTKSRKSKVSLPAKVKKPKKLLAKKVQLPKAAASPNAKLDDSVTFQDVKDKTAAKSAKAGKIAKPGKPASLVQKKVSKKASAADGH